LCWQLQQRGARIGFHAAAMDWHHRRNSLAMYWRQQKGYGKAEALLERKWPGRYSAAGHVAWAGQLYGRGFAVPIPSGAARVYGGVWGSAAYQSLYQATPVTLLALPLMPEWYLVIAALAALSLLSLSWPPLRFAALPLALAASAPIAQAALGASRARYASPPRSIGEKARRWLLTAFLHLVQPLARLLGRIQHGLTPWRRRRAAAILPRPIERESWREAGCAPEHWLRDLEAQLRGAGAAVRRGGDFQRWDLEGRLGTLGCARARLCVEEHGAGRQMLRWRLWPRPSAAALLTAALLALLALAAALDGAWLATALLGAAAVALACGVAGDCGQALAALERAVSGSAPQ
jgi:hypothetical protein